MRRAISTNEGSSRASSAAGLRLLAAWRPSGEDTGVAASMAGCGREGKDKHALDLRRLQGRVVLAYTEQTMGPGSSL
jgi:hypothetical protein